jgi:TRAP transporter TAXI family solute receptor
MRRRGFLALMLLSGCEATDSAQLPKLAIAAEPSYADLANALKAASPMPAEVLQTASSPESLRHVAEGKADLGFASADVCVLAMLGDAPFGRPLNLRALAGLAESYLQIAVRADSGITSLGELNNKPVAVGPEDADVMSNRVIVTANIRVVRTEAKDPGAALRSGDVAAIFHVGGLPSPVLEDIGLPIRLLPVPFAHGDLYDRYGSTYVSRSVPVGTYKLSAEVATIGVPNVLFVRADMAEKAAYQLTELLFRSSPQLDKRLATAALDVALHPGAERYYRESKPFLSMGSAR